VWEENWNLEEDKEWVSQESKELLMEREEFHKYLRE
jgi:hypothetical protein